MKNRKYLLLLLLLIPVIIFFIARSYAYTQEIRKVEIEDSNYDDPGSFHIDKKGEWTGYEKARVTFDLSTVMKLRDEQNYLDVIMIIDVSGSMSGSKLERAKEDAIELTNSILSDSNNKMALITFDSHSQILSGFTNNKSNLVSLIDDLYDGSSTNYNAGLLNVEPVLENYNHTEDRDLIVLFLTDGYPNEDTPKQGIRNEKATYRILKEKYPYMTINGIQYEMGQAIIQDIVDISDNQYIADMESLNNILFEATVSPIVYESFVVTDYVNDDYFYVNSVDDIKVTNGTVNMTVENGVQKIIWTLNGFKTGGLAKMYIDMS